MFVAPIDCNDVELIAQCFEFYESVITENNLIIAFVVQRLAEQPDIQQRLYTEMNEIKGRIGDSRLTYDDVAAMKYAEMVIKEGALGIISAVATRFIFNFNPFHRRFQCDAIASINEPASSV